MKTNVTMNGNNSRMEARRNANNALKELQGSFSFIARAIKEAYYNEEADGAIRQYLNTDNLTIEQVTSYEYVSRGLTFHEFTASNGRKFKEIGRKDVKTGDIVPARYSYWLVINAAAKVRKEELFAAWKAAEASRRELEKAEKEAKKPAAKKAA